MTPLIEMRRRTRAKYWIRPAALVHCRCGCGWKGRRRVRFDVNLDDAGYRKRADKKVDGVVSRDPCPECGNRKVVFTKVSTWR